MRIAYFDCVAGASGDMLLAALVDAGFQDDALQSCLADLNLPGFQISVTRVLKHGLSAVKVNVAVQDDVSTRTLVQIEDLITKSRIPDPIKKRANSIFRTLGAVEARIHNSDVDHVHLHELGGIDTIVDVVGVLLGLDYLQVQQVYASPLPIARGFVKSAHGPLPLPAPATLALLEGVPVYGTDLATELVTPTGAVLLKSIVKEFKTIPSMLLQVTGYGAGQRDLPIPNLLRVLIGESLTETVPAAETLAVLETNIDDLNPEIYDYVLSRLFEAGALDVFITPIQMKKNRPAALLSVLCRPEDITALSEILFAETSTLGVRQQFVNRFALPRRVEEKETPYGLIRFKIAHLGNDQLKISPEFDDCRRIAQEHNLPLREVYRIAEQIAAGLGASSCD